MAWIKIPSIFASELHTSPPYVPKNHLALHGQWPNQVVHLRLILKQNFQGHVMYLMSEYSIDVENILGGSESQYESIPVGNYFFVRDNYFWLIPIGFPFCGGCIVFAGWFAGNSAWLWNIRNPPVQHSEKWMMWPVPTSLKRACTNWKAKNVVNQYPLDVNCISSW